jgi:nucleotide-binding universal stress UspA family protein
MQMIKKILCPIDFSEYSDLALQYASALARDNKAELVVYHSVPDLSPAVSYLEGKYMLTVHDALASNASARLEDYTKHRIPSDVVINKIVGEGNPAESILEIARTKMLDLIVMGTHGVSGYESYLMGSVTNRVLHKATVPVLVISKTTRPFINEAEGPVVRINRIVCPIDFDTNNSWMVGIVISFAQKYNSAITFLHVMKAARQDSEEEANSRQKLKEITASYSERYDKIELEITKGDPAKEILRISELQNADLVIMGHHTRKPVEDIFLGSVARRVITNSKCPVLVARTLQDAAQHEVPAKHDVVLLS